MQHGVKKTMDTMRKRVKLEPMIQASALFLGESMQHVVHTHTHIQHTQAVDVHSLTLINKLIVK